MSPILIILLIIILFGVVLLVKRGFWAEQPAFHFHNISYYFSSNKVIDPNLPEKSKWTDFRNVQTYTRLDERQIVHLVGFVQHHYLAEGTNQFKPKRENILPYFEGHNDKIFFSFLTEDELLLHGQTTIDEKRMIGMITSRPARVYFSNGKEMLNTYYVDYLCIDKMRRKKGYTQKLIKTHEYNTRHLIHNAQVSLFKREEELAYLVPLTVYKTYGYPLHTVTKDRKLNPIYKCLKIGSSNYRLLNEFIDQQTQFEIRIQADVSNVLTLLQTGNLIIYAIELNNQIVCAYFFRKSCVFVDTGNEVLSCFASINGDDSVFVDGFYHCLSEATKSEATKSEAKGGFGYLAMEDTANNDELISLLGPAEIVSPTAYYFQNYVCKPIYKNKIFIVL